MDVSYSRNHLALTAKASTTSFRDYSCVASASVGAAGVSAGAQVAVKDGDITGYDAGAQYADDDFVLTVKT